MPLEAGARLGRYEVREILGVGGMGEVYRARDSHLDRDVAVKVLPDAVAESSSALKRFKREARAVAALAHPNIQAIYDFGVDDGHAWAALELLRGETLGKRLAGGPIPPRKAVELARQIAAALGAAHDNSITHRDIKPDNIFVNDSEQIKVLDFGLASKRSTAAVGDTSAPTLTVPGTIMGTIGYMSPEQVRGEVVDQRSDVFSFGCVLFEMLTGRRAFEGRFRLQPGVVAGRQGVGGGHRQRRLAVPMDREPVVAPRRHDQLQNPHLRGRRGAARLVPER